MRAPELTEVEQRWDSGKKFSLKRERGGRQRQKDIGGEQEVGRRRGNNLEFIQTWAIIKDDVSKDPIIAKNKKVTLAEGRDTRSISGARKGVRRKEQRDAVRKFPRGFKGLVV